MPDVSRPASFRFTDGCPVPVRSLKNRTDSHQRDGAAMRLQKTIYPV
ncbi:MAG: hypothetical protein HGA97_08730 [Chlorobiaceae bacterium]|nr:hypothetical protein [Chlorobiaceae bacterium]